MDDDDLPVGRLLSRREAIALLGGAGAALLAGRSRIKANSQTPAERQAASCIARPELTEGPYFVDERLRRADIRLDPFDKSVRAGAPLQLSFVVSQLADACVPLAGAAVDVWQCDALGAYSDVQDPGFNTLGHQFLRGYQITNRDGVARFLTIYPGWYSGRTVHIHFKIRTSHGYEFTSQLFLPDLLTDRIHTLRPYSHKGRRDTRNAQDEIYQEGGSQLMLAPVRTRAGYQATFNIGLQM